MHSTPVQPPQSLLFSLYFNLIIVEELDLITTAFLVWHNTLNLILIPRHCKTSLFFSGQSGNRCLNASQHSSVCFLQKRNSYDSCLCSSKRALLWFFACLRDTSLCFLHEGLLVYFASDQVLLPYFREDFFLPLQALLPNTLKGDFYMLLTMRVLYLTTPEKSLLQFFASNFSLLS